MAENRVECRGSVREVYIVEAESEAEALKNWFNGHLYLSEAQGVEPISAVLESPDGDS